MSVRIKLKMKTTPKEILEALNMLDENDKDKELEISQNDICTNIKNKIQQSQTMDLLQEETLEDGSVVLTINV